MGSNRNQATFQPSPRHRRQGLSRLWGPELLVLCLLANSVAGASAASVDDSRVPWDIVAADASQFVLHESPDSVFPFQMERAGVPSAPIRTVYAHYFPIWRLSLDNKPLHEDFWALNEQSFDNTFSRDAQKYKHNGGFFRDRPITPPPYESAFWQQRNLAIDILRARRIGIDGFIVGLGDARGTPLARVPLMLCDVASHIAPGFRVVAQPDLASLGSKASPAEVVGLLSDISNCPAAERTPDGQLVVAPFAPQLKPIPYWNEILDEAAKKGLKIALVPDVLAPQRFLKEFAPLSHGLTYWDITDPDSVLGEPGTSVRRLLKGLTSNWLLPVKAQDVRPKDSIYWETRNSAMLRATWSVAIAEGAPSVHIITWNDLSENSEIEPTARTQFLFYDLTAFFSMWFHSGHVPQINQDAIYFSHRSQIIDRSANYPSQKTMELLGRTPLHNEVEMLAMLTGGATLRISMGNRSYDKVGKPGLNVFSVPATHGTPVFQILRNRVVIETVQSNWEITQRPPREDPVYVGGSNMRRMR